MYEPFYQNPYAGVLPAQQIVQVSGKASVDGIRMAPNSSALLLDNTAPIVWLCTSDGVGRVTAVPYDIKEHQDPAIQERANLEERLTRIEEALARMEGKHEQSDAPGA